MDDLKVDPKVERLMALFDSYDEAYGSYTPKSGYENVSRGKVEIKTTARTIRGPVTFDLWESHLAGERPLGLIPIRENDTCKWGAIDIDTYGLSHVDIVKSLEKHKLPLVVCRSKSGGAHVYVFLTRAVPAVEIIDFLRGVSVLIGWGNSEIFPKQRQVHTDRGDLGSWINMPYFGGNESDRYAVGPDGRGLTLAQFLDLAESRRQPPDFVHKDVKDFMDPSKPKSHADFGDGPPCMQHLSSVGYPEGTRNKGLYAMAIFAKKKFVNGWPELLEKWNRELMDPPLPSGEVVGIIKQIERHDYHYPCKDQPLLAHCNSPICRTRRFGVGGDDDWPVISGMSVLDTEPPLWFLDVEDQRIELTTDELQTYRSFHKICMEQLFKCFKMMKQDAWLQLLSEQMKSAIRIEAPKEVGRSGQFEELLDAFVSDRHVGEVPEDLLVGRPYKNEAEGRVYFRLQDLTKHLENSNFRAFSRGQITARIRRLHGNSHFFNIKGKGCNCFYVPLEIFDKMPRVSTPKIESDPI